MNVYVETNFVLELALLQEQQEICQQLLNLAEADRINLILPAFSFTEPYETLIRREKKRRNLSQNLHQELSQLGRSLPYQQQVRTYQEITEFLVNSGKEEKERFQIIVEKLLGISEIIPLTVEILTAAIKHQSELDFTPQDAIVYASIVEHLSKSNERQCCFINRNSKDFDNPDIAEALDKYSCRILFKFDSGFSYVKNQIGIV
ncbi:PIN domain-containing protein [Dolichospermum sp. ST_con]|nr:PIN domain-containing protein [Dolichospermum sp. ST_con]MDD1419389.1 PIN domain-containing protein [Dolichospermum sp. ST_sed1]MDD1423401.1 PIN domain-containing protein [Dolichospermum sp. ST_sed9]MDD1431606.1 PIN domain-containing protein [Dolichospermum sp. ST_sed6]MDD1437021.1 PIN domain-containing protein [Dolichospermum sp. ST_sed10]MDD1439028.1 PIN domain-containing protein [Dolichospermum sp. ST_sed3]MDD1445715.1 PIN domain-containing protein [Dolichospermum sp. ST_sed8]MDD145384